MSTQWTDCKVSRIDSPLFMGQRLARDENGGFVQQLFIDLPRTEPRILPDAESWSPPDMKNHDAMKDKDATISETNALEGVIFARPIVDGTSMPFMMKTSAASTALEMDSGTVQVCFDGPDTIRFLGKGSSLRIFAPLLDHEAAIDRQDGTYQVFIEATCEILISPIRGTASINNPWNLWHGGTEKMLVDVVPDIDGIYEVAIHITPSSTEKPAQYQPFEKCVQENEALYSDWLTANGKTDSQEAYLDWANIPTPLTVDEIARNVSENSIKFDRLMELKPMLPPINKEKIILSSVGDHDLRSTEFSRRGSFICILENDADRELYISVSRSPEMWAQRSHLIKISPVLGNKVLPYEYDVEPGRMIIRTCAGTIEFCIDAQHRLRIRGNGIHLRMSFTMMLFENVCPVENGSWDVSFNTIGRMLFTPLKGGVFCNGTWIPKNAKADDFIMEWIPDAESKIFEAVAENDYSAVVPADHYEAFDACVQDAERDFDTFRTRYPKVTEMYADKAYLAAWVVWTHVLGPSGNLKNEVVYMTRIQWLRAFGWQQSYQAIAASADMQAAWQLLMTVFDYQDKGGQIPDSVGDIGVTYRVTKPALQGLALLYLLDYSNPKCISTEQWEALYEKMARFTKWWLVSRDRNRSGLPQYFHSDESPGEWCEVFKKGLPIYSADLVSFVALMAEACSRLSGLIGNKENEKYWLDVSKQLITTMIERLWDGERFQSKLVKTGEVMESRCVLEILPIMLGSRLPDEILDKLIEHLFHDEGEGAFVTSAHSLFYNVMISIGLLNAGKKDLALQVAHLSADSIAQVGFSMMNAKDEKPDVATDSLLPRKKEPSKTGKWTSWYAACYLTLAGMICNL